MINPQPGGTPVYAQLAETLRQQIQSGQIPPGSALPSERTLGEQYGLGRHTIRKAVSLLRAEGLVTMVKGLGVVVREREERQVLSPRSGAVVTTRMPSASERLEFGLDDGVPVFAIRNRGGGEELFPGDRYELRWP